MIGGQRGWSLMEVMVVVVIMAIIAVMAYPTFQEVLHGMESKRIKNHLIMALKEARIISYSNRQNIIVCLADENNQCHHRANKKIILFQDADNNQTLNTNELLREYELGAKYGTIEMNVSLHRHYMKYFGDSGMPKGHFGHIKYCSWERTRFNHRVVITAVGHVWVGEKC